MPELSDLRPWEPDSVPAARARARTKLETRIHERRSRAPARRPLVLALAALFVVVVGAGVAVGSGFWRTQHTGHLPVFTKDGKLSSAFHVGSRGSGYCWTSSLATGAHDAYRCMQGNAIHDPCFAPAPHARSVACFLDPWHPVTVLRLTKPLPRHEPTDDTLPWAITTTDGRMCTFLTGATAPMGGLRINYGCTDHSYLIGAPDRSHPLWTIYSAPKYVPMAPRSSLAVAKIEQTVP